MSLLPRLREISPSASAIVITGQPTMNGAISAIRAGAVDFLPKPFTAEQICDRVSKALQRQQAAAKVDKRLDRLRDAVRRLNVSRRMVSKKVDLLCNDLVSALRRTLASSSMPSARRKASASCWAKPRISSRCSATRWTGCSARSDTAMSRSGWHPKMTDYQLGAYMKYTIAGEEPLHRRDEERHRADRQPRRLRALRRRTVATRT